MSSSSDIPTITGRRERDLLLDAESTSDNTSLHDAAVVAPPPPPPPPDTKYPPETNPLNRVVFIQLMLKFAVAPRPVEHRAAVADPWRRRLPFSPGATLARRLEALCTVSEAFNDTITNYGEAIWHSMRSFQAGAGVGQMMLDDALFHVITVGVGTGAQGRSRLSASFAHSILAAGADPNVQRRFVPERCYASETKSALVAAAERGCTPIVELLLLADRQKFDGMPSALYEASRRNSPDVIDVLLRSGKIDMRAAAHETERNNPFLGAIHYIYCYRVGYSLVLDGDTRCLRALLAAMPDLSGESNSSALVYNAVARRRVDCLNLLIAANCAVNSNSQREHPLRHAAQHGYSTELDTLIAAGAPVDECAQDGITALYLATAAGHLDCCRSLIAANCSVDAVGRITEDRGPAQRRRDRYYWRYQRQQQQVVVKRTPLVVAVEKKNAAAARLLAEAGADIEFEIKAFDNCTALYIAAETGDDATLRVLLAAGAVVDAATTDGWRAVTAASELGHASSVALLAAAGANIDSTTDVGWQSFKNALEQGHADVIKVLLAANPAQVGTVKARVNAEMSLHDAVSAQKLNHIAALLAVGFDVETVDEDSGGDTPLRLAARLGFADIVKHLHAAGAAGLGGAVAAGDAGLDLHAQARGNDSLVVEALVAAGRDINGRDASGDTPLIAAVRAGNIRIVRELLLLGADVNMHCTAGSRDTALIAAVHIDDHRIARTLLDDPGANKDLKDSKGKTALAIARAKKLTKMEALLK